MAAQDFSLLLSSAPDAGQSGQQAKPAANDFSLLLGSAPDATSGDGSIFESLLWQESRGRQMNADGTPVTSKKGAVGIAQVMPATAPEAARLAGLEFDDIRYRTDAEYNKTLGKAYFDKQLQDFGGDAAKALAAYNAGPGALRRAMQRAEESGEPGAWLRFMPAETQAYVPAIMSKAGASPSTAQRRRDPYSSSAGVAAKERGAFGAINDTVIEVGNAATGAAKAVSDFISPGNPVSKFLEDRIQEGNASQSDATKAEKQRLAEETDTSESWTGEVSAYLGYAARNPVLAAAQAAGSFVLPGGAVKAAGWLARLGGAGAAGVSTAGLVGGAAAGAALSGGDAAGTAYELVMRTPDDVIAQSDDAKRLLAQNLSIAEVKEQLATAAAREAMKIPAVVGAASGTIGAERLLAGFGRNSGRLATAVKGGLTQAADEGFEEGVTMYEGRAAAAKYNPEIDPMKGVAGAAAAGAVMGAGTGAAIGAVTGGQPIAPELQGAAEKAQQPNSPLSRAAMASNTPEVVAQRQAERAAALDDVSAAETAPAQVKDPAARLAELEAIAKGAPSQQVTDDAGNPLSIPGEPGRFFTQEEKAEYDQLVAMKKATEEVRNADQPKTDEISARVDEISQAIRDNGTLQQMRDAGEDAKGLLKDLAIAKSKSTRQDQREQAIARVEFTLGWADQPATAQAPDRQQGDPILAALNDPAIDARDREELSIAYQASKNPALPERTRQSALDRAREIVGRYAAPTSTQPAQESAPAVLGDIPPQPGTAEESLRDAERREAGAYQFKAEGYPNEAQALQQEADSLREEAAVRRERLEAEARVEQVAAPEVATPRGPGPAAIRKRKATLRQLVDNGLNRVERRDDGFYLVNQTGRQEFKLDGMADAQLARAAVAESIRAGAAQANTSPTEGQKTAGNYKVGEIKFDGLTLAIENPQGSTRSGVDPNGERWETVMPANYGYIRGSAMAADGDKVDIYLPDNARSGSPAWIIDQYNDDGTFDETKTVLGVRTAEEAAQIYDAGYSDGSGPRRRGAITEMSIDDFKAWAMSPAAKKPAGAPRAAPADIIQAAQREGLEIDGTMQVTVDGKPVEIGFVKELGKTESVSRGGRARRTSKKQGQILNAIADAFGKKVKFFYETGSDVGDGFIMPNDPGTIYLNESSSLSPIVVFGHELMHQLKRDNPEAHAAVEAVVAKRMKAKKVQEAYGKLGYQSGQILEELVSDLGGDLMADQSFWSEVFDEVHAKNDATAARKIIAKLAEFITRAINALSQNLRSYADTGAGSALVTDMDAIRAAFKDALADYIQAQGISKPAMQAEILKAGQEAKRSAARRAEETENFKRWFGDSKVVDAEGKPLVVYHGTGSDFDVFDSGLRRDDGLLFFTTEKGFAQEYAEDSPFVSGDVQVMEVYLSAQNPWDYRNQDHVSSLIRGLQKQGVEVEGDYLESIEDGDWMALEQGAGNPVNIIREMGHDGIWMTEGSDMTRNIAVFRSEQIKSAIGNNGDYSLTDPNITRSAQRDMFQEDMIDADAKVKTSRVVDSKGNTEDGVNVDSAGRQIASTRQALENFWKWFGDSDAVDDSGRPALYYHTTRNDFDQFEAGRVTKNSGTFGDWETSRAAMFFTDSLDDSQAYGKTGKGFAPGANVMPVYLKAENVLDMTSGYLPSYGKDAARIEEAGLNPRYMDRFDWSKFDDEDGKEMVDALKRAGYDAIRFWDENPDTQESFKALAVFSPEQVKSALGNRGTFNGSDANITRSAARDDALTVEAYHFSQQPRSVLTTGAFGTGLQGSDREAIMAHPDQRLRQRLSFYVNKGTGVRPEAGVGGIAHKATLSNIYDGDADVKRLKQGKDRRGFESAVLDAGYSGYLTRLEGTQPGQVILLGSQSVDPEILGPRTIIPEAKVVPPPARRDMDIGDRIAANQALPSGYVSPSRWGEYMQRLMPAEYEQLAGAGVFDGDKALYKDEFVSRVRAAASVAQSKPREAKIEKLAPVAQRGERVVGQRVTMSADEKQAIEFSAETTGVSAKEITRVVREHKLAHPPSQGWAPLEFRKAKIDKGKLVYEYAKVPYSFNADADGRSLKPGTPEYTKRVNAIARRMTDEVRRVHQRAAAGDKNAENILAQAGWYKAMRARLRHEFGGLGDLFADLLGATSPNTPVRDNWTNAVDSLRRATRGDFDELIPAWEAWADAVDARETELRAWFNDRMADGLSKKGIKALPEYKQKSDALAAARELPDALLPTKETGKKYGFNGRNVARAMVDLWRVVRDADPDIGRGGTAPKALNFSGNLIGFRERATIDVWAARMLQRLAGGLRVPSMAETGVSGDMRSDGSSTLQFGFGQGVFSDAVKRIRKDPELKTNDKLSSINDDDLQAVVWFVEKELWTVNNWTNAAGEGGSFELEASLTGSEQQQKIRDLRRIIDSSRSTPAAKAEARRELATLGRTVDRFIGGLSIQMSADTQGVDFVPADADMVRLSDEISTSIYEDESATAVLASKALPTEGRYGGIERSLDLEVVAREGYRPGALWKKMLETAREAKQDSTFLSRVLRDDENVYPLTHRPGVEIYFREAASREKLEKTLGELAKEGVEFLTVIVDGRRMTDATRGAMPPAVGVRMQYVPEFEQRYGMDSLTGLDDAALAAKIQEKADEMSAIAERVAKSVGDVSFAGQFWYETNVAFSHEYQEKIDAISAGTAEGAAQEVRGQEWSGQSVRAGLESADRQARETAGSESDAGVLGRDAAGAESQADRIEALKELIACLGR